MKKIIIYLKSIFLKSVNPNSELYEFDKTQEAYKKSIRDINW